MHFDDLLVKHLGEFGTYQKLQFLLLAAPCILVSMEVMSWTFTGATIPWRCVLEHEDPHNTSFSYARNEYNISWKDIKCKRPPEPLIPGHIQPSTEACNDGFIFDTSEISYSATMRWLIICDREYIKVIVQNMYYLGQVIGSLLFGYLGDRFGRKKCFVFAILLEGTAGLSMAFVPDWQAFAFLRVVLGICHPGIFIIANVIGVELVGPSKRLVASVITGVFFAIGQVLLGGLAYGLRDYQHLQMAVSIPAFAFLVYWWLIPESTRWLLAQGRTVEADKQLRRVAWFNKTSLPDEWWKQIEGLTPASNEAVATKRYTYIDLFRSRRLCIRLLLCWIIWPVTSMVYYGISMNPSALANGDRYLTFALSGLVEIPGTIIALCVLNIVGRKLTASVGFFVSGVLLLASLLLSESNVLGLTFCVVISKFAITMVYATIYAYTPELFPTVLRGQALGSCSVLSRFGSSFAGYLALYVITFNRLPVFLLFGISSLVACAVVLVLPETTGITLTDSVKEAEELGRDQRFFEVLPRKRRIHPKRHDIATDSANN